MAEGNKLIVKLAVPVVILLSLILSGTCVYLGWINPAAISTRTDFPILMQILTYMFLGIVFFLTLGKLAAYYKFRQEELDRWGEEAMSGKPPF